MKTCKTSIILSISVKPIQQPQQYKPKPCSNNKFCKTQQNTQSNKSRVGNMKYFEKIRKPIPFLEDW